MLMKNCQGGRDVRKFFVACGAILVSTVFVAGCDHGPTPEEKAAVTMLDRNGAIIAMQDGGLCKIDFTHMGIDDEGLAPIQDVKHARMVLLAGASITDDGLKYLSDLHRMRQLTLKGTKIGDAGLKHLSGLTSLEELDLSYTQVTDAGMADLGKMTGLKKVYLGNTAVTNEGRKTLQDALPEVKIYTQE